MVSGNDDGNDDDSIKVSSFYIMVSGNNDGNDDDPIKVSSFYIMWCYGVELIKVKVEQGWLEGQKLVPSTGKGHYYSFKGIPYAAPPVGKLRFKAPQPPLPWTGTRSGSEHGSVCVQPSSIMSKNIVGKEDCLFLNIYSPNLNPATSLPVMFFIHGGDFVIGSGNDDQYSPDFLMGFDVILVTINYRLGALGFINVGTQNVSGNAGLKDQIAAMQWVQTNIEKFGGDPNCVTIFGQSAGGASVSLHIISQAAKGLFQRAVVMSGVVFNDWAMDFNPERRAFALGRILGIDTDDPNKLVDLLQSLPPDTLIRERPNIFLSDEVLNELSIINYYTPTVEKIFSNGVGQYITEHPAVLMRRRQINNVDVMIGHIFNEGLRITVLVENYILKYYPIFKELLVPRKISYCAGFKKVLELADQIQSYFFGNHSISFETIKKFVTFYSFFVYVYDIHNYIEKLPKLPTTRRFFYVFSIYSSRNVYSKPGAKRYGIEQATHRDDLPYLFDGSFYNLTVDINSEDFKYVQLMCTLYTNFAKYGTPTPDDSLGLIWPEYDPDRSSVIIGETGNLNISHVSFSTNSTIGFLRQLYSCKTGKQTSSRTIKFVRVNVTQGTLEGEVLTAANRASYYSFKGIPYAAPPVGTLRFKAPQPPVSWNGVRKATVHGAVCPQINIFTRTLVPGSEDCLFLNIYTPSINSSLPVMVFIHGGAFISGSGNVDMYGPDFLMTHDIVLVTLNYRLEALGFLSLGTEEVPGNAGLKDQVAALEWVQENIKNFGGDPDLVTIFGQSAGAASVAFHVLSSMSKGLFKRAISMSGVPTCDFVQSYKPVDRAFILGKELGINTNDTTILLNYLQSLSSDKLYNLTAYVLASEPILNNPVKMFTFVPVIEKDYGTNISFLTQDPLEILKNGAFNEVDMMFGSTNQETITFINLFNYVNTIMPIFDRYPEIIVPTKILLKFNPDTNIAVSKIIRQHYFENKTIDANIIDQFVNYTNDVTFVYDINRYIAAIPPLKDKSRYLYKFTAVSGRNYYGNQGLVYNIKGAAHLDDLFYLFNSESLNMSISTNSTEYALVQQVCTLYTNFAKYGNPTPANNTLNVTWPQYNRTVKSYLNIGNTLTTGTDPDAAAVSFWKSIFDYVGLSF